MWFSSSDIFLSHTSILENKFELYSVGSHSGSVYLNKPGFPHSDPSHWNLIEA